MSRTIRNKPSSRGYMRRMKHIGYQVSEESAISCLDEFLLPSNNRMKSWKSRITDPRGITLYPIIEDKNGILNYFNKKLDSNILIC